MNVPVLTVTGAPWEAELVAALEQRSVGVSVVRRCVDVTDLLAVAATGTARAALLPADLRRLDRETVARLAAAGVAVVGLFAEGDPTAERRLRQLGASAAVPAEASPEAVAEAVLAAVRAGGAQPSAQPPAGWSDPGAALPDDPVTSSPSALPDIGDGRLVAVWGPTGAPGRTTVAVTLAGELRRRVATLLADADVYGGVVAQSLGLLDEFPGLAAAARLANGGGLDLAGLARLAPAVDDGLRVLTGIPRAERWPELRPAALEVIWDLCRGLAEVTVVDCAFALEQDEEISFDTMAPRRNGATAVTLAAADLVVAVGTADPVGLQRLVRGLADLREAYPAAPVRVVVTKVRRSAIGAHPERDVRAALERYAGVVDPVLVPYDREGLDAALLQGRPLGEAVPRSPALGPIADLAAEIAGHGRPSSGRVDLRSRLRRRGA